MNINEYESNGQKLYKDFCKFIKCKLKSALEQYEDYPFKTEIQSIVCRAKGLESLKRKLNDRSILDSSSIEDEIKDLAGCKIVFYGNQDLDYFLRSGIIGNETFVVHWDESKLHFNPKEEVSKANEGYRAIHYIVSLKESEVSPEEYNKFKGLRCEIQLHTTLSDLYAHITHDITYKGDKIPGFGDKFRKDIDERLLEEWKTIVSAGYGLQSLQQDFNELSKGQDFISCLDEASKISDNNQRYEMLKQFKIYVLPHYDNHLSELPRILNLLREALRKAKESEVRPLDTIWGPTPGKPYSDILKLCLEILDLVKYVDVKSVFTLLVELFEESDEELKELILRNISNISTYRLGIYNGVGTAVQDIIASEINEWSDSKLLSLEEIASRICGAFLQLILEDSRFENGSIVVEKASIPGTNDIKKIRGKALDILKKLYNLDRSDTQRRKILITVLKATIIYPSLPLDKKAREMISENTNEVLTFTQKIVCDPETSLVILLEIEIQLFRLSQHIDDGECQSKIISIRTQLENNEEYQIYRSLMGPDMFVPSNGSDIQDDERYQQIKSSRLQQAIEYAKQVSNGNFDIWRDRILNYCSYQNHHYRPPYYLNNFLESLGQESPGLALRLLKENAKEVHESLLHLLLGVSNSSLKSEADALIQEWASSGKYLYTCAQVYEAVDEFDQDLMESILESAKKATDLYAVKQIIRTAITRDTSDRSNAVKKVVISSITFLTTCRDSSWTNNLYEPTKLKAVLSSLNENESNIILDNLVWANSIEYSEEQVLMPISENFPENVIELFSKRIQHKKNLTLFNDYGPIPFEFHNLSVPLSKIPKKALEIISAWYDDDTHRFKYYGAKLLKLIFPNFPEVFQNELVELVHNKQEKSLLIALSILENFQGEEFLHPICKEIIKELPEHSLHHSKVMYILQKIDGVTGDYGFIEIWEQKKKEIEPWLNEANPKIVEFANKYKDCLDKQIKSEKRRVESDRALRGF
jgi:ppGpp synthetase/RelA/SpoT-type nucleotidyltranferase